MAPGGRTKSRFRVRRPMERRASSCPDGQTDHPSRRESTTNGRHWRMELGKGSCAACTALIRLCSGLDFFPVDAEVRKLLVERLHRLARNHDHAKLMVDRWLETQTAAPKV